MQNPSVSESKAAQSRKMQVLLVGGGAAVLAVVMYCSGGGSPAPEPGTDTSYSIVKPQHPEGSDGLRDELFSSLSNDVEGFKTSGDSLVPDGFAPSNDPVIPNVTESKASLANRSNESPDKSSTITPAARLFQGAVVDTVAESAPVKDSETSLAATHASDSPSAPNVKPNGDGASAKVETAHAAARTPPAAHQSRSSLVLKQPKKAVRALVAHAERAITEAEFHQFAPAKADTPAVAHSEHAARAVFGSTAARSSASASRGRSPENSVFNDGPYAWVNSSSTPKMVKMAKVQSETPAGRAIQDWQADGRLPENRRFPLPRQKEITSPRIWHEDDTPASTQERRVFGLVVADNTIDNQASRMTLTPEGIPVRVLPEGESALQKHGLDRPLWKRPMQ